jgi:hypothetical protein
MPANWINRQAKWAIVDDRGQAMMSLLQSIAVVVLLLASAGTASAQCAWVLWNRTAPSLQALGEPFDPQSAYPTEAGCQGALQREATAIVAIERLDPQHTVSKRPTYILVQGEGMRSVRVHVWRCLPDTIDPRGPKAR